ncbi:MAG: hypothetical protein ACK53V_13065, partial [Planctomycetota bacterium]
GRDSLVLRISLAANRLFGLTLSCDSPPSLSHPTIWIPENGKQDKHASVFVGWDKVAGKLNQSIFQSKTPEQKQTTATAGPPAVPGLAAG